MNIDTIISFLQRIIPFCLAFDALFIGLMIYRQIASNATRDWLSAPGKILSSRVSYKKSGTRNTFPWVTYAYEVDGKPYQCETVAPGVISTFGAKYARKIVARYPSGSNVTVYYNPKDPAQAFLERYAIAQAEEWKWLILPNLLPLIVLLYKLAAPR